MTLIDNKDQLLKNVQVVEHYLSNGSPEEKTEIFDLIRRGRNLLAYEVNKELRFAPSRFLGYIDNNIQKHNAAKSIDGVDGRETTPVINKVLGQRLNESVALEEKYLFYCRNLGIEPSKNKRTYWNILLEQDFRDNELLEGEFPEGRMIERIHKTRERNSKVVEIAKSNFKAKHGKLFCQVCDFDFEAVYGALGKDFIEGHHTVAVSEMKEGHITKPEDIALLCANCHRMVHKKRPWLDMKALNSLLNRKK